MNGFVKASDLPTGLSRESELEEHIRQQDLIIDKLNTALEAKVPESSGFMKPQEKKALLELLSDIREDIKKLQKDLHDIQNADLLRLIAEDRRRIAKLEHSDKDPGQTALDRAKRIDRYMDGRLDHKASYEALKGFLKISDGASLSRAIKALGTESPGKYATHKDKTDKRKKWLIEVPKIA